MLEIIEADKESVFPREVVLRETEASRAMHARRSVTADAERRLSFHAMPPKEKTKKQRKERKQGRTLVKQESAEEQTHVLFGGLIARLESVIRDDKGLREALAAHEGLTQSQSV